MTALLVALLSLAWPAAVIVLAVLGLRFAREYLATRAATAAHVQKLDVLQTELRDLKAKVTQLSNVKQGLMGVRQI